MPPEIPPMCGVLTCDHEEPGKAMPKSHFAARPPAGHSFTFGVYPCQQPAGRCEIHNKESSDA